MSRRTKLLITALFLVLLAVPMVYLTITWHPENPLRFQLVEHAHGMESDPPSVGTYATVYVKVTNTSAASIYLDTAELTNDGAPRGESPSMGTLYLMLPTNEQASDVEAQGELMIPPHGIVYANWRVYPQHLSALRAKDRTGVTVTSFWNTSTRLSVGRTFDWLYQRLPDAIRPRMRDMSLRLDRSPLEPYATDAPAEE